MAWLVLQLIKRLGRYAIVIVLVCVAVLGFGWFRLFDVAPLAGLISAIVVIPALTAGTALALGVLVVPGGRAPKVQASRAEAPGLWALWDEMDPKPRRRRTIAIDDAFNASIQELRGPLGLGRHEVLTLGLPLLMTLDEAALRAVIAHEVGHARLSHISGSANIGDFVGAFDMLFRFADPDHTFIGGLAAFALEGGLRRLERTRRAMSRADELAADAYAGPLREAMARALVLIQAVARILKVRVYDPAQKQLLGAMTPPPSPVSRIAAQLHVIHASATTDALAEPAPDPDPEQAADERLYGSTHPPFEERLKSLGFDTPPRISPVALAASAHLLPPDTLKTLTDVFEQRWRRDAERFIENY